MSARRPSYFSRLAPAPADRTRLLRLQPPRLLFRQSPAAGAVAEVPVPRSPVAPATTSPRPVRAAAAEPSPATALVRTPTAETAGAAVSPTHRNRPAVAPPPASRPTTGTADAARVATKRPRLADRPAGAPRAVAAATTAAATTAVGQSFAAGEGKLPPVDAATAAPVTMLDVRRARARDRRSSDIPGDRAPVLRADALPRQAAIEPEMPPAPRVVPAAAPTRPVPSETAAEPRGQRMSPTPPAPLRPAIRPAVADAAAGLRIGTLEVRVAAPSVPAPPQVIVAPPPPRGAAGAPGRISRPFASFGFGQS